MTTAILSILTGMTEGNFSFPILLVGVAQLIVMLRRR